MEMLTNVLHLLDGTRESRQMPDDSASKFTNDPIPANLLFPEAPNFLVAIPPPECEDIAETKRALLKHYRKIAIKITNQIEELTNLKEVDQMFLDQIKLWRTDNKSSECTSVNAAVWRPWLVLYAKQKKLGIIAHTQKINWIQKNITPLERMREIVAELIDHPRRIAILLPGFRELPKTATSELIWRRLKSITFAVDDLMSIMSFLPRPFSEVSTAKAFLKSIIGNSAGLWDSVTGYLCETEDFMLFCEFFQSRFSSAHTNPEFARFSRAEKVDASITELMKLLSLTAESEIRVLGLMVSRFWFSRSILEGTYLRVENEKLSKYLNTLRSKKLRELANGKFRVFDSDLTAPEYIESIPMLHPALGLLFDCLFRSSPDDCAYALHSIQIRLAGFAAGALNKRITEKITVDSVHFLWRLLLIASTVPVLDGLFQLIEDHMRLPVYHGEVYRNTLIAQSAFRKLVEEADK
jgi:hypothetical protein